jgi:hypothetical protein
MLDDQRILVYFPASIDVFIFSTASIHTGRVKIQAHTFLMSPPDEGDGPASSPDHLTTKV